MKHIEFQSDYSPEISAFSKEIQSTLSGFIHFDIAWIRPALDCLDGELRSEFNKDLAQVITSFAEKNGLFAPEDGWREIGESTGEWILQSMFMWDIVHNLVQNSPIEAMRYVHRFAGFVMENREQERARYYTGGISCFTGPPLYDIHMNDLGFSPATSATFEAGMIMVTREKIGLIWIEGED